MKKKYYILVLTLLSLFVGQSSYAIGEGDCDDCWQGDFDGDLKEVIIIKDKPVDVDINYPNPPVEVQDPNPGRENEDDTSADSSTDPLSDICDSTTCGAGFIITKDCACIKTIDDDCKEFENSTNVPGNSNTYQKGDIVTFNGPFYFADLDGIPKNLFTSTGSHNADLVAGYNIIEHGNYYEIPSLSFIYNGFSDKFSGGQVGGFSGLDCSDSNSNPTNETDIGNSGSFEEPNDPSPDCMQPCSAKQRQATGKLATDMCPCEGPKQKWFIDEDNDNFDNGVAYFDKFVYNPGPQYKIATLGPDCDDNPTTGANVHKLNKCGKCEVEPVSGSCNPCDEKISKKHLIEKSKEISVLAGNILAVYNVETGGSAFTKNGIPKILFERHHFSNFTNHKYDNTNPDISGTKKEEYGTYQEQLDFIKKAYELDPEAAIKSASFGAFQILGSNYSLAGYSKMEDFYNDMLSTDANKHLDAFISFIKNKGLIDELQIEDWHNFAKGYNGKSYDKPGSASKGYNIKMATQSEKYKNNPNLINEKDCL